MDNNVIKISLMSREIFYWERRILPQLFSTSGSLITIKICCKTMTTTLRIRADLIIIPQTSFTSHPMRNNPTKIKILMKSFIAARTAVVMKILLYMHEPSDSSSVDSKGSVRNLVYCNDLPCPIRSSFQLALFQWTFRSQKATFPTSPRIGNGQLEKSFGCSFRK